MITVRINKIKMFFSSNAYKSFLLFLALVILCSCSIFKSEGQSLLAQSLPLTNVKALESYRDYIKKNLPFKNIQWEAIFKGEKIRKLSRLGDYVYVETDANKMHSIYTTTGFKQWQIQLPGPVDYFIATVEDLPKKESELKKLIGNLENDIAQENKSKNRDEERLQLLRRQFSAYREEFISLRLKDVIYLTCKGAIYCIDRASGNILWQNRLAFVPSTTPCASIASIFIGSMDYYRVWQIDANLKYEQKFFKAQEPVSTTPIYDNLNIYFASMDGKVYAYDAIQNKLLWSYQTEKSIKTDMILDEGILYVGSNDYAVYALDRYAGILLWKFETGGSITSKMLFDKAVEGNSSLYVNSSGNGLYAIDLVSIKTLIKDPDNPENDRERVTTKGIARWQFKQGKSFLMKSPIYAYVIGNDNNTLYTLLNNKPATMQNSNNAIPSPDIIEKYDLSLFPVRYGDMEEKTVYLGTSDGYLLSIKE